MIATLYYIPFSPWSQKARCALQHHELSPRLELYTPFVGELALRYRLKRWRGRVSVPILFTDEGPITDSWDIALYADRTGSAHPLIPADERAEVSDWNMRSERLLDAGRGLTMLRALHVPEAALEALPQRLGKVLGERGALLAVRQFNAKYQITEARAAQYERTMRDELGRLRAALADGRRYILGELTYADFAMAMGLMMLSPLPDAPMGPAMRRVASDDGLAAEYADLVAWRDALHAAHPW
jgi:glutathione S-transferase